MSAKEQPQLEAGTVPVIPNNNNTNALVPQSAKQTRLAAFTPANLTEAIGLSKLMASSDMVPKDYKGKAANILLAMQFGSEVGLAPLQSLQSIAVINGRPCLWGDGALALVMAHQDFEDIQETTEGTVAKCTIRRRGRSPVTRTFSDEDAKAANLLGKEGPWRNYKARMRSMRARGFALRDSFADALKGISIAEEAMDIPADTSPAKQRRDSGAIDVDGVSSLTPSAEPNRGHGNEGMQRRDTQHQPDPKPEPVMCGDCGQIDKHEESCKHYAKAQQDAKTSKPTTKGAYLVTNVRTQHKKGSKESYLVLEVATNENKNGLLYVWHKSLHEYLLESSGKTIMCEVSAQEKDGATYYNLEHLLEIAGQVFVDNKPAVQGGVPMEEF